MSILTTEMTVTQITSQVDQNRNTWAVNNEIIMMKFYWNNIDNVLIDMKYEKVLASLLTLGNDQWEMAMLIDHIEILTWLETYCYETRNI